jgi:2',3'-cyclic-nucleotide 2'-phosphodiesterase (5'-nucleotidase family)
MRLYCSPTVLSRTALFLLLLRSVLALAAPDPDLPFGDINVLVVTDVHSFIGGHKHEPDRNADYGDVVSFYEQLKAYCNSQGSDLFFVMNGDWIHGTGLAMDGNASALVPLLNQMPWDVITVGNHEAYNSAVVEIMRDEMIPNFGVDRFVTSNVLASDTMEPFGSRYRVLQGTNNTVLVFGFMYNLHNPSELLAVTRVQDAIKEEWFQTALEEEEYDAILVLAHMGDDDPLVATILKAIRGYVGDKHMPVQFLTGHTHARSASKVDLWGHSFEAGGYLDTVGFVSFPTKATASSVRDGLAHTYFRTKFLNASKGVLRETLGVETLQTENGTALATLIHDTQHSLGLDEIVGCPPKDYFRNRSVHAEDSLWKLWTDHVIKTQIFKHNDPSVMMVSSNSWRYDVLGSAKKQAMTLDDVVAIAPFMEPVVYIGKVPDWIVRRMNSSLNTYSMMAHAEIPDYILVGDIEAEKREDDDEYDFYTHEFNVPEIVADLKRLNMKDLVLRRTGGRDTLYWLNYIEQAWPCSGKNGKKNVVPWFQNTDELEDEETDGKRTSEDFVEVLEEEEEDAEEKENLNYQGYEGYIPPSAVDQYKDVLPPAAAPSAVGSKSKPKQPTAPPPAKKPVKHSAASHKKENAARRKKIRKTITKIFAIVVAAALLMFPLYCLFLTITGRNEDDNGAGEIFYDQSEMRSLRRRAGRQRPMPAEIEFT